MNAETTLAEVRTNVVMLAVALASDDARLERTALDRLGALLGIGEDEMNGALRFWEEHRPQEATDDRP